MQCFVYKGNRKEGMYLYLAQKDDFQCVPEAVIKQLGEIENVLTFELTDDRKLGKEDPKVLRQNLEATGFHLQMPDSLDKFAQEVRSGNSKLH